MGKKECTIHLIHAPKGGCGKTTTAVNLAVDLARGKYLNSKIDEFKVYTENETKNPRVLIIDADFSGSSLEDTMSGYVPERFRKTLLTDKNAFAKENGGKIHFDIPEDHQYYSNLILRFDPSKFERIERYITKVKYRLENNEIVQVDALFCERKQETKALFAPNTHIGESANVKVDLFEAFFEKLLEILRNRCNYDHIVIDLTAGQDQYTNSLRNILGQRGNDSTLYCFAHVLMTFDRGSINDAINYACELIERKRIIDISPKIQLILNETHDLEMISKNFEIDYNKFCNKLKYIYLRDVLKVIPELSNNFYFRYEPFIDSLLFNPFKFADLETDYNSNTPRYESFIVGAINERNTIINNVIEHRKKNPGSAYHGLFTGMNEFYPFKLSEIK